MANSLYDMSGSSNNKSRVPSFDEYKDNADEILKYADELRQYFGSAQTHDDLDSARESILDNETDIPDKIIEFFYKERKNSLGPNIKTNWKSNFNSDERDLQLKAKAREEELTQKNMWTRHRATYS